jgi:uncharacterized membrane protein YdjX (TVP38/TMEM64 family)
VKNSPKWLKITALLIILVTLIWYGRTQLNLDAAEIRDWILGFSFWAPIVYMLIYTVRPLIFFPASVLSITGGLAFGAGMGTMYTVIGATSGAVLSFLVARKLGKNIANKEWKGRGQVIQTQLEKNGFFYVLLLRFIPLFNFDLISYSAGISKVRFRSFLFGTLLGIIPGTFAYNFLGSSLISGSPKIIIWGIFVFTILTVIPIWIRKKWFNEDNKITMTDD